MPKTCDGDTISNSIWHLACGSENRANSGWVVRDETHLAHAAPSEICAELGVMVSNCREAQRRLMLNNDAQLIFTGSRFADDTVLCVFYDTALVAIVVIAAE